MTVGGLACAMCGFVRTTEDVDILIDGAPENVEALLRVLGAFGEGHARELQIADFTDEEGAIRVVEEFPVNVFVRLQGHRYEDLLPFRRWHTLGTRELPYLGVEGLLLLKQRSHREKDRIDVQALRRLREPSSD